MRPIPQAQEGPFGSDPRQMGAYAVNRVPEERNCLVNVGVFGRGKRQVLTSGWTREAAVSFFGRDDFDLTQVDPGGDARFTAVAIFGRITLLVEQGSRVAMSGFNLFGKREITVTAGDGPAIAVRAISVFGRIEVTPQVGG
jgi:hypothetical protein